MESVIPAIAGLAALVHTPFCDNMCVHQLPGSPRKQERPNLLSKPNLHFCQNSRFISLSQVLSWLLRICICHYYFIKIQAILLDKSMTTRLALLHRSSNSLRNNDLDSIDYLFRLPLLLYCMRLRYLYVRSLIKHHLLLFLIPLGTQSPRG